MFVHRNGITDDWTNAILSEEDCQGDTNIGQTLSTKLGLEAPFRVK